MHFPAPLVRGTLIRREKRFLAHVRLDDGRVVIAHTNNSGRMTGCSDPGSVVWLSPADRPGRKLKWTWELVEVGPDKVLAGINTMMPNRLVEEAIRAGLIPGLSPSDSLRSEVRYGTEGSRVDLLLEGPSGKIWIEVKNVTLVRDGVALFPDAVTARGAKHLRELGAQAASGDRGVLVFVVQRAKVSSVGIAEDIDPAYAQELGQAMERGVEVLAWQADVRPEGIALARPLPFEA